MQHDIFVSWASADELIAETIVEALRHQGLSCWFSDDSVPPGKDWDEQISLAIEGCRLMLVILSEKSIRSRYVKKEIILALDDGLTIVPLRVADVKLPHEIRLTLAGIQHVDVFPDVRKHLDKLAKDLRLLLAKIESSSPEVTLIAPKAGDAWPAGSQQTIRWKAVTAGGSEVSDIRIDLRRGTRDEPRITDAASGLAATSEEYAWQVPARLEPASDYQLQVTVVDDAKRAGCVQATFAIAVGTPPVEPRTATEETPKAAPAEAPTISPAAVVQHTTVPAQAPIRSGSVTSDEASSDSWALLFFT
ncbi:MAG TPA: TIR domain-containing protein, partial [Pirellulales bacterium]|nr:TIR domain-containing protein [Pirellulales bacterium]